MDIADSRTHIMHVAIIGSGPSGVAAASVLLEKGYSVDIYDGGEQREDEAENLRKTLQKSVKDQIEPTSKQWNQLLNGTDGLSLGGVLKDVFNTVLRNRIKPEAIEKRNLGSKFAFRNTHQGIPVNGVHLPRSLAIAGLSNVWGGACYPLRPEDYQFWPVSQAQLIPWYEKAEQLLGLNYQCDGLSGCYPVSAVQSSKADITASGYLEPVIAHWQRHNDELRDLGADYGRARIAVNHKMSDVDGCQYCGLCLTGCPVDSIWHSSKPLQAFETVAIRHFPGYLIHSFDESGDVITLNKIIDGNVIKIEENYDAILLAAGALSSLRVAAQSLKWQGKVPLLSNDLMVLPFINRTKKKLQAVKQFGLSEAVIAMGARFTGANPAHMQLYRFSLPLLGPIANLLVKFPAWLRKVLTTPFNKLIFGFVYLHSEDSTRYGVTISSSTNQLIQLNIGIDDYGKGKKLFSTILQKLKRHRVIIGLSPILSLAKPTPDGFSCHLGGTLPMKEESEEMETDISGKLAGTNRCYVVDASVFPALPAQNLTLTVMANSMRVADGINKEGRP